jgi:hypothetical protein
MSGLNNQDIRILRHYAENGNRELYWNYIAQKPDDDNYALLALGVVRNDNAPGQVANSYAQNYAREHNGVNLSERQWERFGADLVRADLAARERQMSANRPDLALNLPVRDVQNAHDVTFRRYGIDENAWTPRLLLDASRRHGGEPEAERLWANMMDNSYLGIGRGLGTMRDAAHRYNDGQFNATSYLADIGVARAEAVVSRPNTDPDVIGATSVYYAYNKRDADWSLVSTSMAGVHVSDVRDTRKLAELNDAREVRLERQQMKDDFHPADPNRNRQIISSPWTFAENNLSPPAADPRVPNANGYAMYRQIEQGVEKLSASAGGVSETHNAQMSMSLYACADRCGLKVVNHLVLNEQGREHGAGTLAVMIQGSDPYDPANPRAYMSAVDAANKPVGQSLQQIEQQQTLAANRQQMQEPMVLAARETPARAM